MLIGCGFLAGLTIAPVLVSGTSLVESRVAPGVLTESLAWTITGLTLGVTAGSALAGAAVDAWGAQTAFAVPALAAALAGRPGALRSATAARHGRSARSPVRATVPPRSFPRHRRSGNPEPMTTRKLRGAAATAADAGPAEPVVEFAEVTPYEQYVGVRQLQALVRTVTDHPAEPSFLVVTQIMELWFTLLRREWERAQRSLRADDLDDAVAAIRRSVHHLRSLNAGWGSLTWMTPAEFNGFRDALGRGVGVPVLRVPARGVPARAQGRVGRPAAPRAPGRARRPAAGPGGRRRWRTTSSRSSRGAVCRCRPTSSTGTGRSRTTPHPAVTAPLGRRLRATRGRATSCSRWARRSPTWPRSSPPGGSGT